MFMAPITSVLIEILYTLLLKSESVCVCHFFVRFYKPPLFCVFTSPQSVSLLGSDGNKKSWKITKPLVDPIDAHNLYY